MKRVRRVTPPKPKFGKSDPKPSTFSRVIRTGKCCSGKKR